MRENSFIRQDTDYAVRALLQLALAEGGRATGQELAQTCEIPTSFAYKILKKLTETGLLRSHTGRGGGFELRREPASITLENIVKAVQGPVTARRCVLDSEACPLSEECPVSAHWRRVQECITGFLSDTNLQELAENFEKSLAARESGSG